MARRNSLRYRAETFASANAGTLPENIAGDYVWRWHINGLADVNLTLNDDGTFSASQAGRGPGKAILNANGTYSVDGRILSLRPVLFT